MTPRSGRLILLAALAGPMMCRALLEGVMIDVDKYASLCQSNSMTDGICFTFWDGNVEDAQVDEKRTKDVSGNPLVVASADQRNFGVNGNDKDVWLYWNYQRLGMHITPVDTNGCYSIQVWRTEGSVGHIWVGNDNYSNPAAGVLETSCKKRRHPDAMTICKSRWNHIKVFEENTEFM